NNDGVVNTGSNTVEDPGDRRVIGNSAPRYQFGVTLSAQWNGIGISAFFQGVGRKDWYPSGESSMFWGKYARCYGFDLKEHCAENVWSEDNPNAYWPRLRGNQSNSGNYQLATVNDRYLQNMAYVRLKNLQIDYSFSKKICKALYMSDLRIYLQGENLFTASPFFKHCKTMDPEGTTTGDSDFIADGGAGTGYPFMRTYTLGLSISF
ncbi:MAG: SusC/RagA family TonB-linked outer membrane protein, partial [Muribaculaceae bacterium]|nr:SusC/RagA family TonB-linked outer membrane protein [Muribaculaceae bacterium]